MTSLMNQKRDLLSVLLFLATILHMSLLDQLLETVITDNDGKDKIEDFKRTLH